MHIFKAGSSKTNEPRLWNKNTDLCVDVKTELCSDPIAQIGKHYRGVLTHDRVEHYTFTEKASTDGKRNPRLYDGPHITITRRDDGSLRPNFKHEATVIVSPSTAYDYAIHVYDELLHALLGLVEEGSVVR